MSLQYQHGSYKAKLFDKRWLTKRDQILERDKHQCVICGAQNELVVHHKQYHFVSKLGVYRDPWDYDKRYLVTLCRSCHDRGHYRFKVPVKNV
jgi:5-methylcytosine-specific restriction endonuclease McrA